MMDMFNEGKHWRWRAENVLLGTHENSQQYNKDSELFKWGLKMWLSGRAHAQYARDPGWGQPQKSGEKQIAWAHWIANVA